MTGVPFMHAGLLVHDLDEAIETFGATLGMSFTEPVVSHNEGFSEERRVRPVDIRYAYSFDGPPHYELIEAHEHGLYGRQMGFGLHHLGMWSGDCASTLDSLTALGLEVEATIRSPQGELLAAYFKPTGLQGMRLEVMDEISRPRVEAWLHGDLATPRDSVADAAEPAERREP